MTFRPADEAQGLKGRLRFLVTHTSSSFDLTSTGLAPLSARDAFYSPIVSFRSAR